MNPLVSRIEDLSNRPMRMSLGGGQLAMPIHSLWDRFRAAWLIVRGRGVVVRTDREGE